jgi:iron(III) transport system substrate-binding protein
MRWGARATAYSVLSGALLVVAACSPAPPAAPPPAPAAQPAAAQAPAAPAPDVPPALVPLIEGAKKETVFHGQWGAGILGGSQGFHEFISALNKKYGLNLQAQYTPGRDMQGMVEQIAREQAAGQPSSTALYLGNSQGILDGLRLGTFQPMDWASLIDHPVPDEPGFDPIAPDGVAIAYATIIVGIPYNTTLVRGSDVPRSMEDVFKPQWKGKIASTPYAAGLREFAMPDMLGREYILDYTRRLSQQIGGLIRCGENERITSGEFIMLVFTCGGNDVLDLKRRGAPIDHTIAREATVLHMRYGGIPKNSSAPNSAALLIAYLHSPEGQELLWRLDGMDLYLYPEANTKKEVEQVKAAGGKVAYNSPQWLLSSEGFIETQRELERILREATR